ncbi:DUF1275 domain-containing protein [Glaciihabitans arcticus]|uniref:DUF1275 domain-containing protein n=1 Tax=Glaciihabitans arcticus TaxID=2668039 RepID=A0A4Q9GT59_9MICO|nr:YoaK family protein [Glaciihabitans arcticus]TBN57835.1 DUF1275 domain-containing protein [Glaciihabitans arcticus]
MARLPAEHSFTAGLLMLTASTGIIDAASYLALDRVFTGNMTGNVLFIGFALVGVAGIPLLNNVIALLGFVVGSIVSGRIIGRGHRKGLPATSAATLAVAAVIIVALGLALVFVGDLPEWALLVVTFVLASTMGAQVSAVKPIGNSDVTTIVVTNTVANLARDSRLGGGRGQAWLPRLLAVVAMGLGAAIGAGLIQLFGGGAALLAAAAVFAAGTGILVATNRR